MLYLQHVFSASLNWDLEGGKLPRATHRHTDPRHQVQTDLCRCCRVLGFSALKTHSLCKRVTPPCRGCTGSTTALCTFCGPFRSTPPSSSMLKTTRSLWEGEVASPVYTVSRPRAVFMAEVTNPSLQRLWPSTACTHSADAMPRVWRGRGCGDGCGACLSSPEGTCLTRCLQVFVATPVASSRTFWLWDFDLQHPGKCRENL